MLEGAKLVGAGAATIALAGAAAGIGNVFSSSTSLVGPKGLLMRINKLVVPEMDNFSYGYDILGLNSMISDVRLFIGDVLGRVVDALGVPIDPHPHSGKGKGDDLALTRLLALITTVWESASNHFFQLIKQDPNMHYTKVQLGFALCTKNRKNFYVKFIEGVER